MSELSRSASGDIYIPTGTEKKRVVSALLFMGIIMMLARGTSLSQYERYYLSLALSLWSVALMLIFIMIIVLFVVPFLGYFLVVVLLARIVLLVYAIQQSWNGRYNHTSPLIRVFVGLGDRLLTLFSEEEQQLTLSDLADEETYEDISSE